MNNRADSDNDGSGDGIFNDGGTAALFNTLIAGNVGSPNDLAGASVAADSACNLISDPNSAGGLAHGNKGNILGQDNGGGGRAFLPLTKILDPTLRNNGGPTLTHALIPASGAIDAGLIAAVTPTSEVQTVTLSGTTGTFTLTFNGQTTVALAFNATAADVQTALHALSTIGGVSGSVAVTKVGARKSAKGAPT